MDNFILAIVLCQIHVQAVEYIKLLDDQTINSKQVLGSIVIYINYNCCSFKKEAVING